jgi:galactose-1-phosphate uridylyltransferase
MNISFEKRERAATFHDPRRDFSTVSVPIEHRFDPLTNRSSRIVSSAVPPSEQPYDIDPFVTDDEGCVFCPDLVESVTPTFEADYVEERGGVGDAVSFPNITPYAERSVVVVLTRNHHLSLDELTVDLLLDGMRSAFEGLGGQSLDETCGPYVSINMNFYPSSGSSIVHPHMHGIADDVGTTEYRRLLENCREYYDANGRSYWEDLVSIEREKNERYIGSSGSVDWVGAFAPKHFEHVYGIVNQEPISAELGAVFEDLVSGITKVLSHYADSDFNAFNFALFLHPDHSVFPPMVQIIARAPFDKYYASGVFWMQQLHDDGIVEVDPEKYSDSIGSNF